VKKSECESHWVWGAVTASGEAFRELKLLWESRHRQDEYLGDLLNASIAAGNIVRATATGEIYMDVGTLEGYRAAQQYLEKRERLIPRAA
jgi:glucose-1-phosphate thymidylyltransferase